MASAACRPRVGDLVFLVYGRPLHPELFDVLAERRIEREDCEVLVRITRTGHAITWTNATGWLTEVAAARDECFPDRRLLQYRMRGEHCGSITTSPRVQYQMSFQVETLPPDVFEYIHNEIIIDGTQRGFLHNFQPHHRLALAPLGFVTVEGKPGCLTVQTFHTFPDELTIVKSQSLIELKG